MDTPTMTLLFGGFFFLWAFLLTVRLAMAVPKDGPLHSIGGPTIFVWSILAGFYGLTATVLISHGESFFRSYGGLSSALIPGGFLLLLILYKEFKRDFMGGHKPFVNPWCDDIAEECRPPE
jgi:hypothetical protein